MRNTLETLNDLFRLIIRFFAILGFLCFLNWLYLLITGEYTSLIKEVGVFTGRVVTLSVICVVIWKGAVYYYFSREEVVEEEPEPEEIPLPNNMTEAEYIKILRAKKSEFSYTAIQDIMRFHPNRKALKLEMMNWLKFWTESKNQYRMTPQYQKMSRGQIKRMEAKAKKRSSPTEVQAA